MSMSKEWFDDLNPADQWAVNEALDNIIGSNSLKGTTANDLLVAKETSVIANIMIGWATSQTSSVDAALSLESKYTEQQNKDSTNISNEILLNAAREALNTVLLSPTLSEDIDYVHNTSPQKNSIEDFRRQQQELQALEWNNRLYNSSGGNGGVPIISDGAGGHSFLDAHGVANAIPVFNPIPSVPENSSLKEPNKIGTVDWTLLSSILQTMEWPPTQDAIELVQSVAMPLIPGVNLVTALEECSKTLPQNSREKYMAYSIIAAIELDKVEKYQLYQATVKGMELKKPISQEEYSGAIAERVLIMQSQGSVSPIQFASSHTVVNAMPVNQYSDLNQLSVLNLDYDNMKKGYNFKIRSGNTTSPTQQASFLTKADLAQQTKNIVGNTGMNTDGIANQGRAAAMGKLFTKPYSDTKLYDLNGYLLKHPNLIESQSTNSKLSPQRANYIKGGSTTPPASTKFTNLEGHLRHRLGLIEAQRGNSTTQGK